MRPLLLLLTLFTLYPSRSNLSAASSSERPHVIVILADDQGWGDLSLHGNQNLNTPALDRLASQGAQFTNFYVQPVCSPTRAEFLTGRYYPRSGVYSTGAGGERINADEQLISEVFRDAGYATGAFGKWHSGTQAPYHPNTRGFDEYYGFTSGHWGSYFDALLDHNGEMVQSSGYLPDRLTTAAIEFIEKQHKQGRPSFTYLALPTPHSPMQTTDEDWARFEGKKLASRATDPATEDLQHTRAALAMVENIDQNVARLLARLDELDIEEDTIVVYFTDNGPNGWRYNGGMQGKKGGTDEGGVRSPLFIRYPSEIEADTTIETIAGSIDLLPTLAELAHIEYQPQKRLDGISLAPELLNDHDWQAPPRLLYSYWHEGVSARSQDYRLDYAGRLYHIPSDREQRRDLSQAKPDLAAALTAAVSTWKEALLTPENLNKSRPLTVGYPGLASTQLPARDAQWSGNIKRSARWPNCSYLTGWTSDADRITFDVEVGQAGTYTATILYAAPESAVGTEIILSAGERQTSARIQKAHTPPAYGRERDRVDRSQNGESYVKDFAPLDLGQTYLSTGQTEIKIKTLGIPNTASLEFRMLTLDLTQH
ncbi:sulfatase-like hydrolase/transferase [Pelagicoccus sp. NFK12]|uniref:Sulfatase-like hydrolase/transferase n=1 Tax=Pelagicoccus enzymogenes TaxID=2773457 RepID=A0A927IIQ9_9BACT|nr:sulfatase-like hydrolase/transferase [Pelagicoccus enzymogenes]MBD5781516.1 sulfatase-like hydrolase/transferase [Pelagicoccus enzymogenes]